MSQRHRQGRNRSLDSRDERRTKRLEKRRERHAVKTALQTSELDDVILPQPTRVENGEHGGPPPRSPRGRRHWKLPFWKRRTALRHERNEAWRRLAEEA